MLRRLARTEAADVELELLALEDVAVGAAGLAGARREDGVQAAGRELRLEERVELGLLLALGDGALDVVRLLVGLVGDGGEGLLGLLVEESASRVRVEAVREVDEWRIIEGGGRAKHSMNESGGRG